MIATWYGIVSFMLTVYVALDGRNFGAGMLHWFIARTPEERRQVIAAIGPLWSWHEVWLVGFGGTVLAVFPKLLAAAFWAAAAALLVVISVESGVVRPDVLGRAIHNPYWWLGLILVCVALIGLVTGLAT